MLEREEVNIISSHGRTQNTFCAGGEFTASAFSINYVCTSLCPNLNFPSQKEKKNVEHDFSTCYRMCTKKQIDFAKHAILAGRSSGLASSHLIRERHTHTK